MAKVRLGRGLALCLVAVSLSPARARTQLDDIRDVNARVNALPLSDCKSFAFEKEARLRRQGIRGQILIVQSEAGENHAILVIDGKWALDNRFKNVTTLAQLRAYGGSVSV